MGARLYPSRDRKGAVMLAAAQGPLPYGRGSDKTPGTAGGAS